MKTWDPMLEVSLGRSVALSPVSLPSLPVSSITDLNWQGKCVCVYCCIILEFIIYLDLQSTRVSDGSESDFKIIIIGKVEISEY